ncbi:MAG TPA: dihydropteroate synthase [Gammaproteobacteria bacterium]|nr:dihydropteroate synthase [Gammaproteobacteria bacterium]
MSQVLTCADRSLDLSCPQVMGILNVTPDSFSDGGLFVSVDAALQQARQMAAEGAAIIDVGGESTRPGATAVSLQEELDRVAPVIEAIARELPVIVSVDTSKAQVMREAVALGAGLINDVRALREPGALQAASDAGVPVCLMHMMGEPGSMQKDPHYRDVVDDIKHFLRGRIRACEEAGIPASRLLIDPGFGFGKRVTHNLLIMQRLREFLSLGSPLLIGVSRKSTIGAVLDRAADERLAGSLALAALACQQGARIIRVHDVAATVDVVRMCHAVRAAS